MKRFGHLSFISIICGVSLVILGKSTVPLGTDSYLFTQGAEEQDNRNIDSLGIDELLFEEDIIFEVQELSSSRIDEMKQACLGADFDWSLDVEYVRTCDADILFASVPDGDVSVYLTPQLDQRIYRGNIFTADILLPGDVSQKSIALEGYVFNEEQIPSHIVTITVGNQGFLYEIASLTSEGVGRMYQKKLPVGTSLGFGSSDVGSVVFVSGETIRDTGILLPGEMIVGVRGYEDDVGFANMKFSNTSR